MAQAILEPDRRAESKDLRGPCGMADATGGERAGRFRTVLDAGRAPGDAKDERREVAQRRLDAGAHVHENAWLARGTRGEIRASDVLDADVVRGARAVAEDEHGLS